MPRLCALVVLLPLTFGLGGEVDACHKHKQPGSRHGACSVKQDTAPMFIEVSRFLSSMPPRSHAEPAPPESALPDDGSQVSAQGPPLTLSEALQLLGSARTLDERGSRSGTKSLQLGQNFTVVKGLDTVAVVYVSGRPDFNEALEEAVLRYTPMGSIFHTPGKTVGNFVGALESGVSSFPSASWYYVADDDSFVHLERLAALVRSHDASARHFIGHRDCAGGSCGPPRVKCQRQAMAGAASPGWACGGPGVLISRPLAQDMAAKRCSTFYSVEPVPVCCGDMVLACCAYDVWEGLQVSDAPSFTPKNNTAGLKTPDLVAVHHILPAVTRALGKAYNSHLRAK